MVGVEPRLHIPGDPEYLVDGVLAEGKKGVGGAGRACVSISVRRLANSSGPLVLGGSVSFFSLELTSTRDDVEENPADCCDSEGVYSLGSLVSFDCVG